MLKESRVYEICNAYEHGVGYGKKRDEQVCPYSDSDLNCAWDIGYKAGAEMADEKASVKKREYQKYEFCKAMNCSWFQYGTCTIKPGCSYSARQFHGWLNEEGFEIIKEQI